jgi:hypothetical protein
MLPTIMFTHLIKTLGRGGGREAHIWEFVVFLSATDPFTWNEVPRSSSKRKHMLVAPGIQKCILFIKRDG